MKKKQWIQLLVGVSISAAALYIIFRDIDFREFLRAFREVKPWAIAASAAVFYGSVWLRGVRWRWLFKPKHDVPLSHAVGGIFICFGFNSVFPARVGEFARAYLVGKRDNTGISTALGTVVAERLLDGLTLLAFLSIAFTVAPIAEGASFEQDVLGHTVKMTGEMFASTMRGFILLAVALMVFVIAIGVPSTRRLMLRVMHATPFLPEGFRNKVEELVHKFAMGFACFSSVGRIVALAVVSVVIWLIGAWSLQLLAMGYPFENPMTFLQAMAIAMIICIFITVPAAPGYWGFFEAGVIFGVTILGIHPNTPLVLSYAILVHLIQWAPLIAVGLPLAWKSHLSMGEIEEEEEKA